MKRSRVREVSIEVTVGAFFFMVLLALGFFTMILSRQHLFRPAYRYQLTFEEILGLREGDNVYVRGVAIGKIKKIDARREGVNVGVSLERELDLREDYRVEILPTSMLGGRYLYVFEGSTNAPALAPGTVLKGATPVDLIEQATRTVQSIRSTLEEGGMLQNLRSGSEKLNQILTRAEEGEGTVGKLLKDDAVYNDLKAIAADLRTVSDKLARGESTLGKLLADDGRIYTDIETTVTNLAFASRNLAEGKGVLGKLLSDDSTIYDDLQASAQSIREITETVNRGEGTLGKLVKDSSLYEDARQLIVELRATVDDYRETAPVTTFVSIFFGAF